MEASVAVALLVLPVTVTLAALAFGPTAILARAYLRWIFGIPPARKWGKPAACGIVAGSAAAFLVIAVAAPHMLIDAAVLSLVFMLASIDWRWRWLPIEWTLGLIALAVLSAIQDGTLPTVFLHMAVPSITVLLVRQVVLWRSAQEALGLGDVWLLAGLGGFLAPFESFLLVGCAAITGLVDAGLQRLLWPGVPKTFGVSYGTHLCIVFLILGHFGQIV